MDGRSRTEKLSTSRGLRAQAGRHVLSWRPCTLAMIVSFQIPVCLSSSQCVSRAVRMSIHLSTALILEFSRLSTLSLTTKHTSCGYLSITCSVLFIMNRIRWYIQTFHLSNSERCSSDAICKSTLSVTEDTKLSGTDTYSSIHCTLVNEIILIKRNIFIP